jgi:hypothetical protein
MDSLSVYVKPESWPSGPFSLAQPLFTCVPRYFQYVRDQMAEHFTWGTDCFEFPLTPPRLVSLVRQAVPEHGIVCLDNGLYKVSACSSHYQ